MAYENNEKKMESVYSQRVRAGKRRTYFFDVRETRGNDYYLTITESRKKFNDEGYDRHKIFLYKEDFNKFLKGITEAIDFVKTDLMPDFDFDAFNHENDNEDEPYRQIEKPAPAPTVSDDQSHQTEQAEPMNEKKEEDKPDTPPSTSLFDEQVDKW